jgi:hypothetical protein
MTFELPTIHNFNMLDYSVKILTKLLNSTCPISLNFWYINDLTWYQNKGFEFKSFSIIQPPILIKYSTCWISLIENESLSPPTKEMLEC